MDAAETRWIAFLRGINVGGKRKLPMAALREAFAEIGASDVRSYLQSGNVVFRAPDEVARALPARFETLAAARFGFPVPVVLRSLAELRSVVAGNPFHADGGDERALHVMFLDGTPAPEAAARLDPQRSTPDAFALSGRHIYLRLPDGVARTKLSNAYFDAALGVVTTGRNWRTVMAVLALAEG